MKTAMTEDKYVQMAEELRAVPRRRTSCSCGNSEGTSNMWVGLEENSLLSYNKKPQNMVGSQRSSALKGMSSSGSRARSETGHRRVVQEEGAGIPAASCHLLR